MATTHTSWPLNARQPSWWPPGLGQLSSALTNELREITEAATAVRDALNAGYCPPSTRQAANQEFETQETTEQEAAKQTALKEEAASREVAKHVLNSVLPCNGFQGTDSRPFTVSVWWQVFDGVNSLWRRCDTPDGSVELTMNALRTRQRLYRVLADHDPLFELGRELPHARQNVQAYIMETKPDQDSSFWSSDQKCAFQMVDPARESWSTKATSEDLWFGMKVLERVASDINRTDEGRQSGTQGETSTCHGKSMRGQGQHMCSVASEIAAASFLQTGHTKASSKTRRSVAPRLCEESKEIPAAQHEGARV
jgi:hypothetical protein